MMEWSRRDATADLWQARALLAGTALWAKGRGALRRLKVSLRRASAENEGQGTTEYAILVGVLVVIAITAVLLFRGRLQSLWDDIANGINSL